MTTGTAKLHVGTNVVAALRKIAHNRNWQNVWFPGRYRMSPHVARFAGHYEHTSGRQKHRNRASIRMTELHHSLQEQQGSHVSHDDRKGVPPKFQLFGLSWRNDARLPVGTKCFWNLEKQTRPADVDTPRNPNHGPTKNSKCLQPAHQDRCRHAKYKPACHTVKSCVFVRFVYHMTPEIWHLKSSAKFLKLQNTRFSKSIIYRKVPSWKRKLSSLFSCNKISKDLQL